MFRSVIQLARERGTVRLQRVHKRNAAPIYVVEHYNLSGEIIHRGEIEYIADEPPRDTKARAIASVRMLQFWPELRRELREEREAAESGQWPVRRSLPNTPEIVAGVVDLSQYLDGRTKIEQAPR